MMKIRTKYLSIVAVLPTLLIPFTANSEPEVPKENLEAKVAQLEAKIERLESLLFSVENSVKDSVYSNINKNLDEMGTKIEDRIYSKISDNLSSIETELETQVNAELLSESLANLEPAAGPETVKITMNPTPKLETADGKFSFQPVGRFHIDYTMFNDDKHNHPDNSDWRRAWLGFKGKIGSDLNYHYEIDVADTAVSYKDVYLNYSGLEFADLKIGHFKPFQGAEVLQSSNKISLIERSAPTGVFGRLHRSGAAIQKSDDNWTANLGVFGEAAGSTADTDDEDISIAGRVTAVPLRKDNNLVHIGLSGSLREDRNSNSLTLSSRGETGEGDNLITTGAISNVEGVNVYGLEAGGIFENMHAQAEYFTMDVNRNNGSSDADFSGWYAQAGYILTGESRSYKHSSGILGGIKPKSHFDIKDGKWGAWEVVGRYSNTDLNDTGAGITGGEMDIWTGGVNWYLNNNARIMANYRAVETDANSVIANDEPQSFTLRTQFNF